MIHSSIPGKYSATDIARGTSEKTSSDWLVRWGFVSLEILVAVSTKARCTTPHMLYVVWEAYCLALANLIVQGVSFTATKKYIFIFADVQRHIRRVILCDEFIICD